MIKYELPSGDASVEKTSSTLGERDYTYPLSKNNRTKALTEALDELWLKQNRIDELEATVDYMERSHNKIVGLILDIDELEQDTDEMPEAQQDLLAIAQNSAVYGVPPKYRDISGRKRIDELEAALKNLLNDYINFDDGHLTEVFQVEASKLLDNNRPVE
jgi:hypothetical protein